MAPGSGGGVADRSRQEGHELGRDGDPAARHPELDCVRTLLPPAALAWAAHRAERVGVGADRALIAAQLIDEETYLRALGRQLGIAFEPLDGTPRARCLLDDKALLAKASIGLLPLSGDDGAPTVIVIAPTGTAVRGLIKLIRHDPTRAAVFRLTTSERFNRFVLQAGRDAFIAAATDDLRTRWPNLSARAHLRGRGRLVLAGFAVMVITAAILAPGTAMTIVELILSAVFLGWLALRLLGACIAERLAPPDRGLPDRVLPVFTVLAALYREAASVPGLLAAIEQLDYPAEKLDVVIAVEADDRETRAALDAVRTRFPINVVAVPPGGPRTKPKALNVALPFARGLYTVIYDAEDRPETDQLRRALGAFRAGPANLACVQARLRIDNTEDSWLVRYFTAEYAAQFDVFMPGLARLGLPLPLGGSSNHFHTETLRKIGAWDSYNVTEDADLGMRLARFGYRTGMIDSTTYEEAPAHLDPWLRQRTRWFKGWMQTWLVHVREPRLLWRQLGPAGFVAFNLMVGGNALGALVHPLLLVTLICGLLQSGGGMWIGDGVSVFLLGMLYAATAVIGYLSSAILGWLGLSRRGLLSSAWVLLLTPLHWIFLSVAAWRALHQLFAAPFAWEKTEHGLARSSHRATRLANALVDLGHDLTRALETGRLPAINVRARDTSADRRRPLLASA